MATGSDEELGGDAAGISANQTPVPVIGVTSQQELPLATTRRASALQRPISCVVPSAPAGYALTGVDFFFFPNVKLRTVQQDVEGAEEGGTQKGNKRIQKDHG